MTYQYGNCWYNLPEKGDGYDDGTSEWVVHTEDDEAQLKDFAKGINDTLARRMEKGEIVEIFPGVYGPPPLPELELELEPSYPEDLNIQYTQDGKEFAVFADYWLEIVGWDGVNPLLSVDRTTPYPGYA